MITCEVIPPPQPPAKVTLTMDEHEAGLLPFIANRNFTVPQAMDLDYPGTRSAVKNLLDDLSYALVQAKIQPSR